MRGSGERLVRLHDRVTGLAHVLIEVVMEYSRYAATA